MKKLTRRRIEAHFHPIVSRQWWRGDYGDVISDHKIRVVRRYLHRLVRLQDWQRKAGKK